MELYDIDVNDPRVTFVEAKPAGWSGEVEVQKLLNALEAADVPRHIWPSAPTDNKCLHRALQSMRDRRSLVRPLEKGRGFSFIVENAAKLDLEAMGNDKHAHEVELTCKVERAEFDGYVSTIRCEPYDHPAVPLVKQQFEKYRGTDENGGLFKCSEDLSWWFSQVIVPWCRGVATRSRGGSYLIMKGEGLERMQKICTALATVSVTEESPQVVLGQTITLTRVHQGGRIILKPEVNSPAMIEILLDNIIEEVDKTADKLMEKIEEGSMGLRALATQKTFAEEAMEKLKQFEEVLGTNLLDVRERLDEVSKGIGFAELSLLAEKEKKNQ